MIIEAKKNPNGMNCIEVIEVIHTLAKSQGFYGRLLYEIEDSKENDKDKYERIKVTLEEQNFKDAVDLVLYFES